MSKQAALKFVVLLGLVSLFCDFTHEGARSIIGPYLAILGASASVVGVVAGFGELVGNALRLASGYLSDKTGKYWTIMFLGYSLNVAVVPLLALAGSWEMASFLMIVERAARALRTPARDTLVSHAARKIGIGWGFGLHEARDTTGAILGPLSVAAMLYCRASYQSAFFALLIPAVLTMIAFFVVRSKYPVNRVIGATAAPKQKVRGFPRMFWLYIGSVCCVALGYADFALISYHFQKTSIVTANWVPIFYAVAMCASGLAALIFGRLFDRIGFVALIIASAISSLFAPFAFSGNFDLALSGTVIWGIGMGAQESIMRSAIVNMVPIHRLGVGYGILNTSYGVFWFLGSASMGVIYDVSISYLVTFSIITQLLSIPLLMLTMKQLKSP